MKVENLKRASELSRLLDRKKRSTDAESINGLRSFLSSGFLDYLEVEKLPNRFKSGIDELIIAAIDEIQDQIESIEKEAETL